MPRTKKTDPDPPRPRRWASRQATAEHLGVSERTVTYMAADGRITAYRLRRTIRTDFGIARSAGGYETGTGVITGSPAFTAPEVLGGRAPSAASDVYSLGATLFCAIIGHAAFERRSGEQVIAQFLRITSEPTPILRGEDIPRPGVGGDHISGLFGAGECSFCVISFST